MDSFTAHKLGEKIWPKHPEVDRRDTFKTTPSGDGLSNLYGDFEGSKGSVDKAVVESVSQKMLTLQSFKVSHFKAILKNKTYHEDQPVTVTTPESEHENVRGQAYYG